MPCSHKRTTFSIALVRQSKFFQKHKNIPNTLWNLARTERDMRKGGVKGKIHYYNQKLQIRREDVSLRGRQLVMRAALNREGLKTRLGGGWCEEVVRAATSWGWANTAIDGKTKETIKGILASFALIDHRWRWVKGLSESGGVFHRQKQASEPPPDKELMICVSHRDGMLQRMATVKLTDFVKNKTRWPPLPNCPLKKGRELISGAGQCQEFYQARRHNASFSSSVKYLWKWSSGLLVMKFLLPQKEGHDL